MARERTGAPEDDDRGEHEHVVDEEWLSLGVHRAPRIGRFLLTGVIGGLVVAAILTAVAGASAEPGGPLSAGPSGYLRVFGVLAALCVGVGLLVSGLTAIALDRVVGRRSRPVIAEHATTLVDDLISPVSDDIPQWVRDAEDLQPPPRQDPDARPAPKPVPRRDGPHPPTAKG